MIAASVVTPVRAVRRAWPASPGAPALEAGDRVHLVGVAGAGMSGLARVMLARGLDVSGCDREWSPVLAALAAEGAAVEVGHDEGHVAAGTALVVASPAVPAATPDLAAAERLGVPVTKRAPLLGALMDTMSAIAVAGTHGKSTTAALAAHLLVRAGMDPTVFVGAEVPSLGGNARDGAGEWLVVEADEYDRSFLHGHATIGVVTSVEHDHPDMFPEEADVVAAFRDFASLIRTDGVLLARAGPAALREVATGARAHVEWFAVGGDEVVPEDVDWSATDLAAEAPGTSFDVWHAGVGYGRFYVPLPGRHNVANAVAALAAAHHAGVEPGQVREALAAFSGVGRRFEEVGAPGGVVLVDDYAHHPSEIDATVAAARDRYPGRRLWAVFQPHTFSRLAVFGERFAASLAAADRVLTVPVFGAREQGDAEAASGDLAARAGGRAAPTLAAAADMLAAEAVPGDVVLIMGAGDVQAVTQSAGAQLTLREVLALRQRALQGGWGGSIIDGALAEHTSLRIGGRPDLLVRVTKPDDLVGWWRAGREAGLPVVVIGRGSNVLVTDSRLAGMVLLNRCEAWAVDAEAGVVVAESGVTLAALSTALGRRGWSGLEPAVGIPGSVGAAVAGNAGAHDWCVADTLRWAEIDGPEGTTRALPEDLAFVYRGSSLKGRQDRLVVRACFALKRDEPAAITARVAAFQAHRRATQPSTPSVGSIFKNPPGGFAGHLIEAAGLKGARHGGAMISDVHANFVVNTGNASAADVRALVALCRRKVRAQFGVDLELEIEPVGSHEA